MFEYFKGRDQIEFAEVVEAQVVVDERIVGCRLPAGIEQNCAKQAAAASEIEVTDAFFRARKRLGQHLRIAPRTRFAIVRVDRIVVVKLLAKSAIFRR